MLPSSPVRTRPPRSWPPEPEPSRFPLRHLWPLGLVVGVVLAAGGVVLADRLWPEPAPVLTGAVEPQAQGGGAAAPTTTAVLVASVPGGAWIAVDGLQQGMTPLLVEDVATGERRLSLSLDGYAPVDTVIDARPGLSLRFVLRPVPPGVEPAAAPPPAAEAPAPEAPAPPPVAETPPPPAGPGRLRVTVQPWGTISIDGEVRRRDTDVAYETELPAGTHRVRVTHPALGVQEHTVTVRPGETARLAVDLNTPGR